MDAISLWFGATDNAVLHVSGRSPANKIEERINFAWSHVSLYLFESDNERDHKSASANTFDISYGGGRSRSSIYSITVSVLDTSDEGGCWRFTSDHFLPNDPLSNDDMVDWENDTIVGIVGEDKNIDEG